MWPLVRIIAGIEASTITSEGTCRLVIPRSESTIASAGPGGDPGLEGGLDLGTVLERVEPGQDPAEAVVRAEARGGELVAVRREDLGEERA